MILSPQKDLRSSLLRWRKPLKCSMVIWNKKIVFSGKSSDLHRYLKSRIRDRQGIRSLISENGVHLLRDFEKADVLKLSEIFLCTYVESASLPQTEVADPLHPRMRNGVLFSGDEIYQELLKFSSAYTVTLYFAPLAFVKRILRLIVFPLKYIFNLSFLSLPPSSGTYLAFLFLKELYLTGQRASDS